MKHPTEWDSWSKKRKFGYTMVHLVVWHLIGLSLYFVFIIALSFSVVYNSPNGFPVPEYAIAFIIYGAASLITAAMMKAGSSMLDGLVNRVFAKMLRKRN